MSAPHLLAPGARFRQYTIVRALGQGGMGVVYEAVHEALGRRVALKTLTPDAGASKEEMLARFVREARAAAALRHPHVVDVFDVGTDGEVPFLAMEYLEGEDLAALLEREGALSPRRAAELLVPVCTAVAAAHKSGIVHRDLKPANVFLAKGLGGESVPKLLDFGISKVDAGSIAGAGPAGAPLTATAALLGTIPYMAPEHAKQSRAADARSDQYALGAILYECVCGTRAFVEHETEGGLFTLLSAILEGKFPGPRARVPSLPEWVDQVISRAMSTDPAARFASVSAFGRALCAALPEAEQARWLRAFDALDGAPRSEQTEPGLGALAAVPATVAREVGTAPTVSRVPLPPTVARADEDTGTRAGLRAGVAALAVACVLGLGAAGVWALRSAPAGDPPRERATAAPSATSTEPLPSASASATSTHEAPLVAPSTAGAPTASASVEPPHASATARSTPSARPTSTARAPRVSAAPSAASAQSEPRPVASATPSAPRATPSASGPRDNRPREVD